MRGVVDITGRPLTFVHERRPADADRVMSRGARSRRCTPSTTGVEGEPPLAHDQCSIASVVQQHLSTRPGREGRSVRAGDVPLNGGAVHVDGIVDVAANGEEGPVHLELDEEQADVLRSMLDIEVRELSYEIASADLPTYRVKLRHRREVLRGLLESFGGPIPSFERSTK